jgi:hypothetical protein
MQWSLAARFAAAAVCCMSAVTVCPRGKAVSPDDLANLRGPVWRANTRLRSMRSATTASKIAFCILNVIVGHLGAICARRIRIPILTTVRIARLGPPTVAEFFGHM